MTQDKEIVFFDIVSMVYNRTGYKLKDIGLGTRVYKDMKIDGDDAMEFLFELSSKYNIDMGEFQFEDYFEKEGFSPLRLLPILSGIRKHKDLLVSDLVDAAMEGRWKKG
ncbi:DUF1493 family protein [Aquiflexum lacus]|uniref:DUF1493 family protein n=1 Tax=Aquiflexum lacus TaxID=2483805 RepID=UPI001893E7C8|nr:DUF1493 family protein [Aquiflexum lacus]